MLPLPAGRGASAGVVAPVYERYRPERPLLYQLIEEQYPAFKPGWWVREQHCRGLSSASSMSTSNAGAFGTVSCACVTRRAMPSNLWRQLQTAGFLRQLRRAAHGREHGAAGN